MVPVALEPEDGALAVHSVLLFPGPVSPNKLAAQALHVRLLGDVRPFFADCAGTASAAHHTGGGAGCQPLFGEAHMEAVSHPYLVSAAAGRPAGRRAARRRLAHCG